MSRQESTSDDHVNLDTTRIIETLERHRVEYLLVGGLGAVAHGATRATFDFDALASRSPDNLDRLADALNELRARYRVEGLDDETLRQVTPLLVRRNFEVAAISTWRTDAGDIDVLTEMSTAPGRAFTFDDLTANAVSARLGEAHVRIAALGEIIASKRHANRGKDKAALPELERLLARAQNWRQHTGPGEAPDLR